MRHPDWYRCTTCKLTFPLVCGIPDFRLQGDRYLPLQEERLKAARLADLANRLSFEQLLDFYYEITDDVPPELARVYKASVTNGVRHSAEISKDVAHFCASRPGSIALDAGCGAGGMLVAARMNSLSIVGVDIALRWLVICRKRLRESGLDVPLVCADVTRAPFPSGTFDAVIAVDLIEHVPDVAEAIRALGGLTKPSGAIWLTAANGRTIGPHPSTRLWSLGLMPASIRTALLRKFRGIDSLRYSQLLSPVAVLRLARRSGLWVIAFRARRVAVADERYSTSDQVLISIYRMLSRVPLLRTIIAYVGPSFEIVLRHRPPSTEEASK